MASTYTTEDGVALISLDDGKVNVLGSAVIAELQEHLDHARRDAASAVVITGRTGVLSAGFDLAEVRASTEAREQLRLRLIDLTLRLFELECPVVVACTGHAMAAGAALLLVADRRLGVDGPYKLGFNEASMGVAISGATVELARYRMPMPYFESIVSGTTFPPLEAVAAGLLDRVLEDDATLASESMETARVLAGVPRSAFSEMRRQARGEVAGRVRLERSRLVSS